MNDENMQALQDTQEWEFESAELHQPVRGTRARAVVSVAFSSEDFSMVVDAAQREGLKMSQFIREAALERVRGRPVITEVGSYSGTPGVSLYRSVPTSVSRTSGGGFTTDDVALSPA